MRGPQLDSIKYSQPLQEIPKMISVLPKDLLEEQNVTNLRDALRNLPGISLQAGEGNPPAGDQMRIRGFNARDDINVNGMRDLGNYFRDPFYIESLEVIRGPNSAFSGRGSAGGTVNFVTKKPSLKSFNRLEVSLGTDAFKRTTLDMNQPLSDDSAMRVNLMFHDARLPGRDLANENRYGLYGAYTWGFSGRLRFDADLLHTRQNDLPDAGLPFDRRTGGSGRIPGGVRFNHFFGHTNDYRDIDVNQLGFAARYTMDNGVIVRNQTRVTSVMNDSIIASPRFIRTQSGGQAVNQVNGCQPTGVQEDNDPTSLCAVGNLKPRDQRDIGYKNQTDFLLSFDSGWASHDLVLGFDVAQYTFENRRRLDANGPATRLDAPQPRAFEGALIYGGVHRFQTEEVGIYALDTMKFNSQWELNAGLRADRIQATATEFDRQNATAPDLTPEQAENRSFARTDTGVSYSLGLVYKLHPRHSIYASTGNAFNISGSFDRNQIQLAGSSMNNRVANATFNTPTEKIQTFEVGSKFTVAEALDVNAAMFRTETDRGRLPAQEQGGVTVPNVQYHINGFEVLATGKVTPRWRLFSGYTYLESEVTSAPSAPQAVGQRLGGTPTHSVGIFSTYDLTSRLTVGGGMQRVGKVTSGVDPDLQSGARTVTADGFTIFDLYSTYRLTEKTQLRVNAFNLFDREHISQLAEGGGQGIPGRARQVIATLRHDF